MNQGTDVAGHSMWYFARYGEQSGPFAEQKLKELVAAGQVGPSDLVWREGMSDWQPISSVAEFAPDLPRGGPPPLPAAYPESKRITAGVLALVLGGFGVHKFYLGMNLAGAIMLLGALVTCGLGWPVVHTIAMIEGLIYLTKSDAQFYQDYIIDRKEWF